MMNATENRALLKGANQSIGAARQAQAGQQPTLNAVRRTADGMSALFGALQLRTSRAYEETERLYQELAGKQEELDRLAAESRKSATEAERRINDIKAEATAQLKRARDQANNNRRRAEETSSRVAGELEAAKGTRNNLARERDRLAAELEAARAEARELREALQQSAREQGSSASQIEQQAREAAAATGRISNLQSKIREIQGVLDQTVAMYSELQRAYADISGLGFLKNTTGKELTNENRALLQGLINQGINSHKIHNLLSTLPGPGGNQTYYDLGQKMGFRNTSRLRDAYQQQVAETEAAAAAARAQAPISMSAPSAAQGPAQAALLRPASGSPSAGAGSAQPAQLPSVGASSAPLALPGQGNVNALKKAAADELVAKFLNLTRVDITNMGDFVEQMNAFFKKVHGELIQYMRDYLQKPNANKTTKQKYDNFINIVS
jgi:uncharacterized protein YoxC